MKPMGIVYQAIAIITLGACIPVLAESEQDEPKWVLNKAGERPEPKVVITNVCAWPNLLRLPEGDIVAFIYNQPSHARMPGDVECWASADEGDTWVKRSVAVPRGAPTESRASKTVGLTAEGDLIVVSAGWSAPGDPEADRELGRFLAPWVCLSKDGGRTWTIDKESFPETPDGRGFHPYGTIVVGADGKLRVPVYKGPADEAAQQAAKEAEPTNVDLIRATQGWNWIVRGDGRTWDAPEPIAHRSRHSETALLHLGNGKWLAAARRWGSLTLYRSEDDAHTWVPCGPLARGQITTNGFLPGHLLRLKNGSILLSYGDRTRGAGARGAMVMFSDDEGRTWSEPYRVLGTGGGDCGYPDSIERKDGQIVTAYYASSVAGYGGYHMGVVVWDPERTRGR